MASLPETLRRHLEKAVVSARDVAEAGARAALERLAVRRSQPFGELAPGERELRVQLRAHARQLRDPRKENGEQEIEHLVAECAYEHWHRMLFARFLAENRLLIHPEHGVPVTLAECQELAAEAGEEDGWALAGRFASRMLPAIFRLGDPVLSVRLAPEHQQPLEKLLAGLPAEVFTADDSLGWVYQFWQTKRKDEVNASDKKIGADELPAVTQLFTEPYMVKFLLHNTLGAWWAGKVLAARPELAETAASEEELRSQCVLHGCAWTYLRFRSEEGGSWRLAAGTFEDWPQRAGEITVLDPCCGSGHFLVEALRVLVPIRMAEEQLSPRDACHAVLCDNLFGLEIDERCTQIAAFNLALAAWTYPESGGYRPLPELQIACSGLSVGAREEDWFKLAGKDDRLREGMRRLYRLFQNAPTAGSLIDPRREFEARPGELEFDRGRFDGLRPLLAQALARDEMKRDAQAVEAGIAAHGMARAAALLAVPYTLVATNVPYLGRAQQSDLLRKSLDRRYQHADENLATAFVARFSSQLAQAGVVALVTPQTWRFQDSFEHFRQAVLREMVVRLVAPLGAGAFDTIGGHVVNVLLIVLERTEPSKSSQISVLDAEQANTSSGKAAALRYNTFSLVSQDSQRRTRACRLTLRHAVMGPLLEVFAKATEGTSTGDGERFLRSFWEFGRSPRDWEWFQDSPDSSELFPISRHLIYWTDGGRLLREQPGARVRGQSAWGRPGVLVARIGRLRATIYGGGLFGKDCVVFTPRETALIPALLCFLSSPDFETEVGRLTRKVAMPTAVLGHVPFDVDRWRSTAAERFRNGLPNPYSDDSTRSLFHGHPEPCAFAPALEPPWPTPETLDTNRQLDTHGGGKALHVAVARLLGYRWPAELDPDMNLSFAARAWTREVETLLEFAAGDGVICIPAARGEQPAADRLQQLLVRAFGATWTAGTLPALLERAGFENKTLEEWLRDGFFEQHCELFHQRPFVWHISDGRQRDGFAALVNYHKLDRKLLERLAYTVLNSPS